MVQGINAQQMNNTESNHAADTDYPENWQIKVRSQRGRSAEHGRKLPWLTVRNGQLTLIVDAALS